MIFSDRLRVLAARGVPWFERAVLVLVCWQVAGLFWWLFAPATMGPMPVPPRPAPAHAESREALLAWFEGAAKAEVQTASEYALMAVIAGKNGVALFKGSDGKGLAVRTGEALDAASRLVAVEPGSATIERGGVRQEIKLPWAELVPDASRVRGGASTGKPVAQTFSGKTAASKAVRITRGQMSAAVRSGNVAGWDKGLSSAPDGGIRIDRVAAQPFAVLLQLKDGDVLRKVNRRPLERVADVSLVFFHFGQNASVDLELIRRGVPMTQHYDIQP